MDVGSLEITRMKEHQENASCWYIFYVADNGILVYCSENGYYLRRENLFYFPPPPPAFVRFTRLY